MSRGRRAMRAAGIAAALWSLAAGPGRAERLLDRVQAEGPASAPPLQALPRWLPPGRPTVALALSGGGARGIAHLGVLQAMHEDGVVFDAIAGTSIGALLGGLVAGGLWPDEIEALLQERDWNEILADTDLRTRTLSWEEDLQRAGELVRVRFLGHRRFQTGALVDSRRLERELYRYLLLPQWLAENDFDRLRYRFRPVATDALTGRRVAPAGGDLVTAIRGSFAVPGVFRPVRWGSALLVDGMLVENLPTETARTLGTDVVVAVDVSRGIRADPVVRNPFDLLHRSLDILIAEQRRRLAPLADVTIEPEVEAFPVSDFHGHIRELVAAGREAYARARDAVWQALESRARDGERWSYDRIEVQGTDWIAPATLAERLGGVPGSASRFRIAAEVARALNFGPVAEGEAQLVETGTERTLRFRFTETPPVRAIQVQGLVEAPAVGALGRELLDRPFALEAARRAGWRARQALFASGRVFVYVERLEWDPATGTIRAHVQERAVDRVIVEAQAPKLRRLERFVGEFAGVRFRFDRLADRLDAWLARGAIAGWGLRPRRNPGEALALELGLAADTYYELGTSLEYRDALGWAGHLRAAKVNPTGHGDRLELMLAGAHDRTEAELRYHTEYGVRFLDLGGEIAVGRLWGTFPFLTAEQARDETQEETWDRWHARVALLRRSRWGSTLRGGLEHERDRLDATPALPRERRSRTSLFAALEVDRRDRLLFPRRGGAVSLRAARSLSGRRLWTAALRLDGHLELPRRQTLSGVLGIGLSGGADRRPYWFDPGGFRDLYGFVPYGAASPQYARAGLRWRRLWLERGPGRLYAEAGADLIRTALARSALDEAETHAGYGIALVGHATFPGPITLGLVRNDLGATTAFLAYGYGLFER